MNVPTQFSGNHFLINPVGDPNPPVLLLIDQAQIAHVGHVVSVKIGDQIAIGQHGRDYSPYPFFLGLVGELIEMGFPTLNQAFLGVLDPFSGNRSLAVSSRFQSETGFVTQGIDQPRLALGEIPYSGQRVDGENLAGFIGMLMVQLGDFFLNEVSQSQ